MRRAFVVLSSSMTLVACSLLTDLGGLSSGATDAGDAGGDVATPVDAAVSADADGAAEAGGRFCATLSPAPVLCEDFDGDDPVSSWTVDTKGAQSVVRVSTANVRSSPRALESIVAAELPNYRAGAWRRSIAGVVNHARLSYSLFVAEPPVGSYELALLRFTALDTNRSEFYLSLRESGAIFGEQSTSPSLGRELALSLAVPIRRWTRVVIDLVLTAPTSMVVTIDGVEALRQPSMSAAPGVASVAAGITYANAPTSSGHVFFDDLVFEVLP